MVADRLMVDLSATRREARPPTGSLPLRLNQGGGGSTARSGTATVGSLRSTGTVHEPGRRTGDERLV